VSSPDNKFGILPPSILDPSKILFDPEFKEFFNRMILETNNLNFVITAAESA
jgi:hypothetical protein